MKAIARPVIEIGGALVDLFIPPCCGCCGAPLPSGILCEVCALLIDRVESPRCPTCALPFDGAGQDHRCSACLRSPPPFASATAGFRYEGPLADGVRALKYGRRPERAAPLAALWREAGELPAEADLALPVPLHPKRLRQRGYNQTVLLSKPLLREARIRLETGALFRVADGPPQASLEGRERVSAPTRAFAVPPRRQGRVEGRTVLLLDDVMTTGATLRACARVLLRAGAESVHVAVFCRA